LLVLWHTQGSSFNNVKKPPLQQVHSLTFWHVTYPGDTRKCQMKSLVIFFLLCSGAFKAAGTTKKPPVQEIHLPSGFDQGLGFGGPGSLNPKPNALPRRASTSSVTSSSTGGDMVGRTGSNWREAAATALQNRNANANANATANMAGGAGGGSAAGSSMYGASIASKLAAAKAALDLDSNADTGGAAAAPGSPGVRGSAAGGVNRDTSGGASGGEGGSAPTVRLTMSMLDRHNRS
jgi:hypothetical protein